MKRLAPLLVLAAAALLAAFSFPPLDDYGMTVQPVTDSLRTEAQRTKPRRPVVRRHAFTLDTLVIPGCVTQVRPFTDTLRFEATRPQGIRTTVVRRMAAKIDTAAAGCTLVVDTTAGPGPTLRTLTGTPDSTSFAAESGAAGSQAQAIALTNSAGTAAINALSASVAYTSGSGWLAATVGTSTPATLALTATAGVLAAGTYVATVTVTADSATNLDIPVVFVISAAPINPPTPPPPTPSGTFYRGAELPRVFLRNTYPANTGTTWTVSAGGNLQTALNNAQRGDIVQIEAGATFTGNFTLPAKPGTAADGWVILRSSGHASLPARGTRVTKADSQYMGKIRTANSDGALKTAASATGWWVSGVDIGMTAAVTVNYGIVLLGDGTSRQNSLSMLPHDIVLDRVYVHSSSTQGTSRCVALNAGRTEILDSRLDECHGKGLDTQAIGGWNGAGPYRIHNNYLGGAGQDVFFGGAIPAIPQLVAADIEITRNHLDTPASWKGVWTMKTGWELKAAMRVLFEGNVITGTWVDGQTGFGVLLYSTNPSNGTCNLCRVSDIVVRGNLIKNVAGGFNLSGRQTTTDSVTKRMAIVANVVDSLIYPGNQKLMQILSGGRDLVVDSLVGVSHGIAMYNTWVMDPVPAWTNVVWNNSVVDCGKYAIINSRFPAGDAAFTGAMVNATTSGVTLLCAAKSGYALFGFAANEAAVPLAAAIRARVAAATAGVVQ